MALRLVAALGGQQRELLLGLYTLRHNFHAEAARQCDHGFDDRAGGSLTIMSAMNDRSILTLLNGNCRK